MPEGINQPETLAHAKKRVLQEISDKGIELGKTRVRVNRKTPGFRDTGFYGGESKDGKGILVIHKPVHGVEDKIMVAFLDIHSVENIHSVTEYKRTPTPAPENDNTEAEAA